jgi:hypothetical protein
LSERPEVELESDLRQQFPKAHSYLIELEAELEKAKAEIASLEQLRKTGLIESARLDVLLELTRNAGQAFTRAQLDTYLPTVPEEEQN